MRNCGVLLYFSLLRTQYINQEVKKRGILEEVKELEVIG